MKRSLLLNIAKGRALIYGQDQIDKNVIPLLIKIAISSCPQDRGIIFKELVIRDNHKVYTSEVCDILNVTKKTALQTMYNLKILKIAEICSDSVEGAKGRPETSISLSKKIEDLVIRCSMKDLIS